MGSRLPGRSWTVSVGGTLVGLGLLLVGLMMAAWTALGLLLVSGPSLAVTELWRGPVGIVLAVAGFGVFRFVVRRDGADAAEESGHSEAATTYLWDF